MDAADRSSLPRRASPPDREPLPRSIHELPPIEPSFWSVVDDGLAEVGLALGAGERAAIEAHVRLLLSWNARINLTALRSAEQVARGHVLDSLAALPALRNLVGPGASVLDLGSGGGYPGLPIAIALPARRMALVDSIAKKAAFLEVAASAVQDALGRAGLPAPDITAIAERAEDLADEPDQRESWDLVVARAVGSMAEVAELCLPLTRRGGSVVAWKRDAGDGALAEEVARSARICHAAGGGTPVVVTVEAAARLRLAGHCLVVIHKHRATPDRYPRPVGERRRSALP